MPQSVVAQGGNYLHQQITDITVTMLSFPSGVKAHIFVSWLHPFKEQKLIVVGDRKMAVFHDLEKKDKLLLYPHSIEWKHHIPSPIERRRSRSKYRRRTSPERNVCIFRMLSDPVVCLERMERRAYAS